MRLLAPAKGADTRPILWRLADSSTPNDTPAKPSTTVALVVPAGTTRAELVTDGQATPVRADADGFTLLPVPIGQSASVRA